MGGERNWDYRYTWLRDSALTIHSLLLLGFHEEAEAFAGWLRARAAELKEDGSLQTMYTIHGGHDGDHPGHLGLVPAVEWSCDRQGG